jgi:serine/threonine protein kinase/tetratricopeptide (TPR) repeat protein
MPKRAILDKGYQDDATEEGVFFVSTKSPDSDLVNGRFRLLNELGRGGMAVVHLAEDIATGNRFALKMMSTRLTGSAKQRFTREFSTIASLKHPYLIEVFEYGESPSGPFFVMELFSGKPATDMIGAPVPQILEAIYKLCEAVDFVHSRRIIHRDIKPANILVQANGNGSGFDIRLSDFGLAKFANSSSSLTGDTNFLGTIAYCAPEQIMREELDHRADIYSLGLVVFELLTGRHAFQESRKDAQALISKQLTTVPTSVREHNKNISVELERAVLKMVAKEQEFRPESTLELRQAIAFELGWSESQIAKPNLLSIGHCVAPFIARENELKCLETFLDRNLRAQATHRHQTHGDAHSQSILFVAGEAGIGKTSLIKRAARAAFVGGARIYDGRCFDGNLAPFQPFLEIVKQILSEQEKCRRRAALANVEDVLASTTFIQAGSSTTSIDSVIEEYAIDLLRCGADLKTLLANKLPPDLHEVPRDTEYVFRSLATFFVELSKIQPMLLFIDDVHWADKSTIALLRHIASRAIIAKQDVEVHGGPPPQLAILGSTRNTTEYSKTVAFVDELCEANLAIKLVLEPLSKEGVQQLIASQLSARVDEVDASLSTKIATECLGNPFYICQTIREWKLSERVHFDGQLWTLSAASAQDGESLPESVRDALRSRLRKLPERTAKTLSLAAAMGSIVDVDLLQSLAVQSNQFEFFDILDDLIGREILRETGKPRVLTFAHDLLREAALSNLTATRRQGIHQVIGEALEKRLADGSSVTFASLAEHFLAAHCTEKAFRYLLKAGSEATDTFAHVDAIPLLERAKSVMPGNALRTDQFALSERLGRSLTAQDRVDDSLQEFQLALDAADDELHRSIAHYGMGKCFLRVAKIAEGRNHFEKALALLGEKQPKSKIGYLFGMFVYGTDFQFRPKWLSWKKKSPATEQLRDLASEIYFSHCMIVVQTDLFAYLYSSIQNARLAKHSDSSDAIALAYSKYGFNLSLSGAMGQFLSKPYIRESKARLNRCKSVFAKALTLQNIGGSAYYSGDLNAAEQYFVELQPELDKTNDWHVGWNIHMRRHTASQRGDALEIVELARQEMEFGNKIKDPIFRAFGLFGLADGQSRGGRFEEAVTCGRESVALVENILTRSVAMQELGRALIQASQYEEAETTLWKSLKFLKADLFYIDFAIQNFSLYPEAIIGPLWSQGPKCVPAAKRKKASWAAMKARFWALSFPNMRAHTLRVSGRVAAASGKSLKAIKYFDKALVAASKYGNRGEYARALIDKSQLLQADAAKSCREQGLTLLKELNTVLPTAEMEGFDRL